MYDIYDRVENVGWPTTRMARLTPGGGLGYMFVIYGLLRWSALDCTTTRFS